MLSELMGEEAGSGGTKVGWAVAKERPAEFALMDAVESCLDSGDSVGFLVLPLRRLHRAFHVEEEMCRRAKTAMMGIVKFTVTVARRVRTSTPKSCFDEASWRSSIRKARHND